jgi:Protein of unknown function (DUF642)
MIKRFSCLTIVALAMTACAQPSNATLPMAGANARGIIQGAGAPPPSNLITNGSFEKPKVPSGSYTTFSTGESFNGWSVVGATGNIAVVSDTFTYEGYTFPAGCGHQFVDLTGSSNSLTGLQQKISVVAGATYAISFKVGNVWAAGGDLGQSSTVLVYVNGKKIDKATNKKGKGLTHIVWQTFSKTFIAKGKSAKIKFINGDPPTDTANGLDCISVTPA